MSHITNTAAELFRALAANPSHALLDVRSPAEFAEFHAAPARNLPLGDMSAASLAAAGIGDHTSPVYLLCQTGRRAEAAADKLAALGFARPVVVTGGTEAWLAAGLPAVRGARRAVSIERQVRIGAGFLVLVGALLSHFVNPHCIWLSGFVGAGLMFAGVTDFCGMGILLAKAPWNRA